MSKILELFRQDADQWHFFTPLPWKKLPDGIGNNPMRRKINGAWEYRAAEAAEAEEDLIRAQW